MLFTQKYERCSFSQDKYKGKYFDAHGRFVLIAVPPDILDYPTSTDMVVREGTNVTLRCAATGTPQPNITWRREGGETIPLGNGQEGRCM